MKRKREYSSHDSKIAILQKPKTLDKLEKYLIQTHALQLTHHTLPITTLAISPDSKYLFSGSQDCKILLFNLSKLQYKYTFQGHTGEILSLAISSDSSILNSSDLKSIHIWSIPKRFLISTIPINSPALSLCLYKNSALLLSAHENSSITIYDISNESAPCKLKEKLSGNSGINSLKLSVNQDFLFSAHDNNKILVWDSGTLEKVEKLEGHTNKVTCLCINERILVSGSDDKSLIIWNLTTFKPTSLNGHKWSVSSLSFTHDNNFIISASYDSTLIVWNSFTCAKVHILKGGSWAYNCVLSINRSKYIVTGGEDAVLGLWDFKKKCIKKEITGHTKPVSCFYFSEDCKLLATGSADKTVRVWNLMKRNIKRVMKGHEGTVVAVEIASNNAFLISGSDDRTLRVWKIKEKSVQQVIFYNHFSSISCVKTFRDNIHFVSAGTDKLLFLYSTRRKTPLFKLKGLNSQINSLSTTHSQLLVAQLNNNTWLVWKLKSVTKP